MADGPAENVGGNNYLSTHTLLGGIYYMYTRPILFHWIVIYPVDSIVQPLNHRDLVCKSRLFGIGNLCTCTSQLPVCPIII